ncbi:hypothetical protein [Pseudomonas sp. GZD-209]|uniref:hypothetical protein n=1 Tax=Pseudomonas sp. GZD-209 TaxID=3404807 RepID=UPI003BB6C5D9
MKAEWPGPRSGPFAAQGRPYKKTVAPTTCGGWARQNGRFLLTCCFPAFFFKKSFPPANNAGKVPAIPEQQQAER